MHFTTTFASLLSLPLLTSAAPLAEHQAAVTEVYKFTGSPISAEGIAVRSNGQIFVSFLDKGEAWLIDPPTKNATKVATFPGTTCSGAIAEISPDVYAVVAGNYTASAGNTPGSWGLWKVDFSAGGTTPTTTLIKNVPESVMWNGVTAFINNEVLVGDGGKGAVYKMNVNTGEYSVVFEDSTMAPVNGLPLGLDGIRYANGYLHYTNIYANHFYQMPINSEGKNISAPTQIWDDLQADDMYVTPGGVAYVAAATGIQKVTNDGKVSTVASIMNGTAVTVGTDKTTLFVAANDGVISSFKA